MILFLPQLSHLVPSVWFFQTLSSDSWFYSAVRQIIEDTSNISKSNSSSKAFHCSEGLSSPCVSWHRCVCHCRLTLTMSLLSAGKSCFSPRPPRAFLCTLQLNTTISFRARGTFTQPAVPSVPAKQTLTLPGPSGFPVTREKLIGIRRL